MIPSLHAELIALHVVAETAFDMPTEDIFVIYSTSGIAVEYRHGGLKFRVSVFNGRVPHPQFASERQEALKEYNAMPNDEKDRLVDQTQARANASQLITAMTLKGFKMPEKRRRRAP